MKKLITLVFAAFAFYAKAQPIQADPNVIIGEDNTYADYWELKAQSDRLDILSTGIASPIIRFAPLAGTGNRLVYMTSDGDFVAIATGSDGQFLSRSGGVPTWVASPSASPGGSDTQLQYRVNSTTFGGISGATSSGTNVTFGSGNLRATSPQFTTDILVGTTASTTAAGRFIANNASQLNFFLNSNNYGGFLTSDGADQALLTGGANFTGTVVTDANAWTARGGTTSSAIWMRLGGISFYSNSSLTDGNTFTPTNIANFEVTTGNLDLVTGDLETNGTTRISNAGVGNLVSLNTGHGDNELYPMNQSVQTSSTPSFTGMTLSGFTANRVVGTTTGGALTETFASAALAASLSDETGSGTVLFGNQAVSTGSSPTFSSLTLSGVTANRVVGTTTGGAITETFASSSLASSLSDEVGSGTVVFGNQAVSTGSSVTFATVNTGQGANELYDMNQNVQTTDAVTFAKVTASANVASTAATFFNDGNNTNRLGVLIACGEDSGSGTLIQFGDGDQTVVGQITFSGTTTTYSTSSDERLKKNIRPTRIDPSQLIGLAKDFTWKEDGKKQTGFIAQEVYKVFPWAVHAPDSGMWSVDYGQLTPLLAKGYEDNESRITALENSDDKATHWALWMAIAGLTVLVLGCLYTISKLDERISKLENK